MRRTIIKKIAANISFNLFFFDIKAINVVTNAVFLKIVQFLLFSYEKEHFAQRKLSLCMKKKLHFLMIS